MADDIAFTQNIRDLSNMEGFQFEFLCDRCGNSYRSPFQRNVAEKGRGLLRAASSILSDRVESLNKRAKVRCPHFDARVAGGKFCPACWKMTKSAMSHATSWAYPVHGHAALQTDPLRARNSQ